MVNLLQRYFYVSNLLYSQVQDSDAGRPDNGMIGGRRGRGGAGRGGRGGRGRN